VEIEINALPASPGSPARRCPDISSWESMFGKRPFVSLKQGVRDTFAWYKTRLGGQN
jgi:nucleoside-diphosphate-sugar epimerase